jgi:ADP-ribose pyrophosphatase
MITHHLIPPDAACVFRWIRADIYQKNQLMYDGSYSTFEYIRYLDGAFVIPILPNGNILLTLQEQPGREKFYSFPGGSFDFHEEDPLACAERELLEETWYRSDIIVPWFRFNGTANVMTYTHYYIARDCRQIQEISPDPGEKIQLVEVSFDELLELVSDKRFHHHWNLLPIFYEARLFEEKKQELRTLWFGE